MRSRRESENHLGGTAGKRLRRAGVVSGLDAAEERGERRLVEGQKASHHHESG